MVYRRRRHRHMGHRAGRLSLTPEAEDMDMPRRSQGCAASVAHSTMPKV
jgi:hypothetical protein